LEHDERGTSQLTQQRARGIRTAIIIAAVIVVLRYLPVTSNLFCFSLLENFAYDVAFSLRSATAPSDVVIIAIDDESLRPERLGRFPWPRRYYADLLKRLDEAKAVGFDVLFTEPDRNDPQGDACFVRAVQNHGRVVLGAYRRIRSEQGEDISPKMPGYPPPAGGIGMLQGIQPLNFTLPIAALAEAAAGIGYVDIAPDPDGVYRRVTPLRAGYDGVIYPHFATEIARVASGTAPQKIVADLPTGRVSMAGHQTLVDPAGTSLINYCGPTGTIPWYSFWDVLQGKVAPEEFAGKIVLVGATAPGLHDIRPAPYRGNNRFFLGVETNANIVNSLLVMPPLKNNSRAVVWLAVALLLGTLAGWVVWSCGEVAGPLIGGLLLAFIALPSFFVAFWVVNEVIPYGAIVLAVALPVALGVYERLGAERRMIRDQFSVYVSANVLEILGRHPEIIREGRRRQITVLFADVRGSTALSEKAEPEVWLAQLNEYMNEMTEAIFEYDGYLDKFMGDGIMAIWNAFGTQPHHSELAVRAALAMLERLEVLNERWRAADNRTPFRIGIGLHTGTAVLGDAGSQQRRQYTAIGDVVNTAARIEEMNKELGTTFIVSQTTADETEALFELREIGEAPVRGRTQPIGVYEVLGEKSGS